MKTEIHCKMLKTVSLFFVRNFLMGMGRVTFISLMVLLWYYVAQFVISLNIIYSVIVIIIAAIAYIVTLIAAVFAAMEYYW